MTAPAFHALDFQHIVTLAIIAAVCFLIAWKARSGQVRRWLGYGIGFLLVAYATVLYMQQGMEHALSWAYSLPLEPCNLMLIACIISLIRPSQPTTEIAYYCGLGTVLQAIATPELSVGFPSWGFIFFFWGHGITLIAIIFLVSDGEFRPRKASVVRMMVALNIYGLIVGALDWITGWNYGYLCRKPSEPSLFDVLGPWPWYLLTVEVVAFVTFLLLDLLWKAARWLGKRNRTVIASNS